MRLLALILIFAAIFPLNSNAQNAECDYGVGILIKGNEFDSHNFTWKMKAAKIEGASTKITGTAKIEDFEGVLVKSYMPWTSESISSQKTSGEYTPNLKPGVYTITAAIDVECHDRNGTNNIDIEQIKIKNNENDKLIGKEAESDSGNKTAKINQDNILPKQTNSESDEEKTIHLNQNNKNRFEVVYESSSEKAKGLILLSLLALSILLNAILIWKR